MKTVSYEAHGHIVVEPRVFGTAVDACKRAKILSILNPGQRYLASTSVGHMRYENGRVTAAFRPQAAASEVRK